MTLLLTDKHWGDLFLGPSSVAGCRRAIAHCVNGQPGALGEGGLRNKLEGAQTGRDCMRERGSVLQLFEVEVWGDDTGSYAMRRQVCRALWSRTLVQQVCDIDLWVPPAQLTAFNHANANAYLLHSIFDIISRADLHFISDDLLNAHDIYKLGWVTIEISDIKTEAIRTFRIWFTGYGGELHPSRLILFRFALGLRQSTPSHRVSHLNHLIYETGCSVKTDADLPADTTASSCDYLWSHCKVRLVFLRLFCARLSLCDTLGELQFARTSILALLRMCLCLRIIPITGLMQSGTRFLAWWSAYTPTSKLRLRYNTY